MLTAQEIINAIENGFPVYVAVRLHGISDDVDYVRVDDGERVLTLIRFYENYGQYQYEGYINNCVLCLGA